MRGTMGTNARRRRRRKQPTRAFRWARSTDAQLLSLRMRDLGVRYERSRLLTACVRELYRELERRRIRLRPHVWLSHDWFSPEHIPGIAIPFFLAHPRLMRLERHQMLEVEGGSRDECMRILRHECGHAFQHAYRLHRRRDWQRVFGLSSTPYPDVYRPNPASRRYVQHLRLYYAQSHPDEDFAETFAVWLQAKATWRRRYEGWPALKKLEYVDDLMAQLEGVAPPVRTKQVVDPLSRIGTTLQEYYDEKRNLYSTEYPDIYDRDLRRLFSDEARHRKRELASVFLRRNRAEIRKIVSRWTGEYQFTLDQVLTDMIGRCRELKLRLVSPERTARLDFAMLLTVRTLHFHYSRRNWVPL